MKLPDLLLKRGLAQSETEARGLILAGKVLVNDEPITKLGFTPAGNSDIRIRGLRRFVSRGGEKLDGALAHFGIPVAGRAFMDIGASTGGFTDCLLQAGATKVYAVDVGHGQLAWKLRQDPRVVVMEKTNARHLTPAHMPPPFALADLVVIDCSFISLRKILPPAVALLRATGKIVALIKPQFETQAKFLDKGVLKDELLLQLF